MAVTNIGILILFGTFVIFLLTRVPISFALAFSSLLTCLYMKINVFTVLQKMVSGMNSYTLLAIPFFLLCGEIMNQGGISGKIVTFANSCVGHWHGGVAQVNVLSSMLFGGISGSPVADCASLGPFEIKLMTDSGYDNDYSIALTVASSCQATLIPPSHNMVIYALVAGSSVSVGGLLMGGLVPGIILGIALMIYVYFNARHNKYPRGRKFTAKERWVAFRDGFFGLLTAVIIVVGVCGGICTATESAAVACVYAFIITFFVYREVPFKAIFKILRKTLKTLAMVLALMSTAQVFSYLMAYLKVPALITGYLIQLSDSKVVILLLINLMLLFLGCIMDMAPLIVICTPILLPVVQNFGMSATQFGILLILNLSIGLCTPPVGCALYVGCAVGKGKMGNVAKAMLPMYSVMIIVLIIVTFVPKLSLWLPALIGYIT